MDRISVALTAVGEFHGAILCQFGMRPDATRILHATTRRANTSRPRKFRAGNQNSTSGKPQTALLHLASKRPKRAFPVIRPTGRVTPRSGRPEIHLPIAVAGGIGQTFNSPRTNPYGLSGIPINPPSRSGSLPSRALLTKPTNLRASSWIRSPSRRRMARAGISSPPIPNARAPAKM